jgi:hypothetical protein
VLSQTGTWELIEISWAQDQIDVLLAHSRKETDTKTSEEATGDEQRLAGRRSLQDDTEVEDKTNGSHQTHAATKNIGNRSGAKGTEEGTGRQDRDDEGVFTRGDASVGLGRECLLPEVHGKDARNGSCVISEQDTTEGDEETDDNGRPCRTGGTRRRPERDFDHVGRVDWVEQSTT